MNNKIILTGLVAAMTAASCSLLDREPHVLTPETFYRSEKELLYGLTGVYGALNNEEVYGNYYSLMISNADDLCYYNRPVNGSYVYWYNHSADEPNVYQAWSMLYAGIKNANEFMHFVDGSEFDPQKTYYNEARFLRAYYHFLLAQAWGDVPLRTERTLSPDDTQKAATPQAQVLVWCIEEMEAVAAAFPDSLDNAPSRLTRTTMEGILARVCLFTAGESVARVDSRHYYGRAAYWAKEVIADGRHRLNPDYADVFINMIADRYDRTWYESMWEADFLGDRSDASSWSNGRIGDLIGLQNAGMDANYAEWNANFSYGMYNGSLKLWDLYFRTDRTPDEQRTLTDARLAWNLPPYNWAGRKKSGSATAYDYRPGYDKTPYFYNNKPSFAADPDTDTGEAVCRRNAGKWRRETTYEGHKNAKMLYTGINFPILRYADVLLMYAEAVNEYAGAPDELARECVRQVRSRAGIATDERQTASYDAFRTLVRNERARELAFEGLRKWDLIRWGEFVAAMNGYGEQAADERWIRDDTSQLAEEIGANVRAKHVYLPIPSKELSVNKLLKQNPLW